MNQKLEAKIVDGIKCFSSDVAHSYENYPDSGFDLTDENAERSFWVKSRNRLFKYLISRNLPTIDTVTYFEIGCGTGNFINTMVDNPRLYITGSEIYHKGLIYAQRNTPDVDFIQLDISQGYIGQSFNIISAFDVLEHIEDDNAALSNIHHMLDAQGMFIMTVPQHMFLWSQLDHIVKHKRRYSRKELISKLHKNGFDITYCSSFVFTLFPLMLISRLLDKKQDKSMSDHSALGKMVKFPIWLNHFFDLFMRVDELLIKLGLSLPFGGTLLVIAKKSNPHSVTSPSLNL